MLARLASGPGFLTVIDRSRAVLSAVAALAALAMLFFGAAVGWCNGAPKGAVKARGMLFRLHLCAIAVLSCAVWGESMAATVQLYGVIDTFMMYTRNGGMSSVRMGASGYPYDYVASDSYWGISGVEDLGQGTRVEFRLESGMHMTNGTSRYEGVLFNREANIAIGSAFWGTLKLGRQYPAVVSHTADPFFYSEQFSPLASSSQLMMDLGKGVAPIPVRISDAISYQTPWMNGLFIHALYAPRNRKELIAMNSQGSGGSTDGDTAILATYTSGPWVLAGSYNALRPVRLLDPESFRMVPAPFRTDLFVASATYTAGALQTSLMYTLVRPKAPDTVSAQIVSLGTLLQHGAHILRASLLYRGLNGRSDRTIGGAVGYDYLLSKRLSVYTRAGVFQNSSGAIYGLGVSVPERGANSRVLAFGISQRF